MTDGDRDPERLEQELDRAFTARAHTRRRFVGRTGALAFAASGLSAALAACGIEGTLPAGTRRQPVSVRHPRTPIGDWTFSNWPLYIDKSVLKTFDKRYGGDVKYIEDINDNDEFYGKVRQQLQAGRPIGRDLVVLTDYMAARWVRNQFVTPMDKRNVPNFVANLESNLRSSPYDPKRSYTAPWQSGATGIGYNPKKTGRELTSIKDLFDPAFKGRVTMLGEAYDSVCSACLMNGIDATKATMDQLLAGVETIQKAADAGQFRRFTGNDYTTDLAKGNVWAALAYSGDVVQLQADNPELRFVYPEEGAMTFTDNMMMPAKVQHPYAAETMINFVYDPKIAAKLAIYVNYISPVKGIKEIVAEEDPDIAENPLIFPPDEIRAKLHPYPALDDAQETQMKAAFAKVTGA
jgi:spermidine/putrescine transport system substrate-binding protein